VTAFQDPEAQRPSFRRRLAILCCALATIGLWFLAAPSGAMVGAPSPDRQVPEIPVPDLPAPGPATPGDTGSPDRSPGDGDASFDVQLDLGGQPGEEGIPSRSVVIILGLTVLAVAPSLLILMTSFTRIIVVLAMVRNALGLQSVPPNQVLAGLALFLSLFVMAPTLGQINDEALQPYLEGEVTQEVALGRAETTIKGFMLANTRSSDLELMVELRGTPPPEEPMDTSLITVVPAFVLSELQSAFIIGIVVFVPFLVLDLVVAAALMSLGMMMMPPVFVSLPLKLLLFVMVNGWALVTESLVRNYHGVVPVPVPGTG
jgi:flagellar biosynthesis protein FliP